MKGNLLKNVFVMMFLLVVMSQSTAQNSSPLVSKIAFGSCGHQDEPEPVLDLVVKHKPELFVYLGDNIYADTRSKDTLRMKYDSLAAHPEFQRLKKSTRIVATWDDHDYGENDAGKYFPMKKESKEVFLNFFNEPANSDRRKHEGVYTSYMFESNGHKLQLILLDVRTFRSNPRIYRGELSEEEKYFYPMKYYPLEISDSTMLGDAQWKWLEGELKKPADIRLIGSGSQFGNTFNGYEGWSNFPHERDRMLNLVKNTKANGVIFLTGDVHYAEISKLETKGQYPIYDITASGITSTWLFATPNDNRIEGPVMDNHFGLITIDWSQRDPSIKMEIWDVRDNQRIEYTIRLSEISFK